MASWYHCLFCASVSKLPLPLTWKDTYNCIYSPPPTGGSFLSPLCHLCFLHHVRLLPSILGAQNVCSLLSHITEMIYDFLSQELSSNSLTPGAMKGMCAWQWRPPFTDLVIFKISCQSADGFQDGKLEPVLSYLRVQDVLPILFPPHPSFPCQGKGSLPQQHHAGNIRY